MTTEELYEIIKQQQEEIDKLQKDFIALKEWSDLNDYWLREMIDALTESVDRLMGIEDYYDDEELELILNKKNGKS